jgi:hypothetical protein
MSFANAQKNQELIEQLTAKDEEMHSAILFQSRYTNALQTKNRLLEKRVAELEKALENSSTNNWGNTFNNQAAKVVNSKLEKTIEPLMQEVDRLNSVLLQKEQELVRLQMSDAQESDAVVAEFGEIGERFGWSGWSSRGYRAASGMLCTGIRYAFGVKLSPKGTRSANAYRSIYYRLESVLSQPSTTGNSVLDLHQIRFMSNIAIDWK